MSTRLVVTIPLDSHGVTDGPGLGALITSVVIPDLTRIAEGVTADLGEINPGQYGWTDDGQHGVRVHWAIRNEDR